MLNRLSSLSNLHILKGYEVCFAELLVCCDKIRKKELILTLAKNVRIPSCVHNDLMM